MEVIELKNDSVVKVKYTFESEHFKEMFLASWRLLITQKSYKIYVARNEPTIIIETTIDNLCSIFYIMGALSEREHNTKK